MTALPQSDDDGPPTPSLRRDRCGRFRLERLIATGGMGDVYLGVPEDAPEQRVVVKKVRLDHVGRHDVLKLFQREIELNVRLAHPNIVEVLEVGEDADGPFMAMEYLRGHDLAAVLRELEARGRAIPLATAVYIVRRVLLALEYAHGLRNDAGLPLGIVHRDISPSNVFLTDDGEVKLLDFGIAKLDEATPTTLGAAPKGKGAYMAPEQCRNGTVDARTDLFALGAVLYEATTMQRAFPGDNLMATLTAVLLGETVPPRAWVDGYPEMLEHVVLRALRSAAEERFQSAEEMGHALDEVIARARWSAGPADIEELLAGLHDAAVASEPRPARRAANAADMTTDFEAWKTESAAPPSQRRSSIFGGWSRRAVLAGVLLGAVLTATWRRGGVPAWSGPAETAELVALVVRSVPKPSWAAPRPNLSDRPFVDEQRGPDATPCRSYRARFADARGDARALAELAKIPIPSAPGPGEDAADCAGLDQLQRRRKRGEPRSADALQVTSPPREDPSAPEETASLEVAPSPPLRGRKVSERLDELRAPEL